MKDFSMYINGSSVAGDKGYFDVVNPASGEAFARCSSASVEQLNEAVAAAQVAFPSWRSLSGEERGNRLLRIADDIEREAEALARIIVQEQGKPLELALSEVTAGAAWTRYAAGMETPIKLIEEDDRQKVELRYKPLGVVASITPWNWPFMIAVWHIMPALRVGNCVINKPSALTPISTLLLIEIMGRHLPPGVINGITGQGGLGSAMTTHKGISKIVFTGSTETGQSVMSNAAVNLKRLTLELGGNDAAIVLPDASVEEIVGPIFDAAFLNMGQTCTALKRLYVHESVYGRLCEALVERANQQRIGDGLDDGVTFGPVQNGNQLALVDELVRDARDQGANILCGGERLDRPGYFYPPTIVSDISDGVRLVDEEQFGPVLPVICYRDIEDALARANTCEMGLGGSVWGTDEQLAEETARRLESGVTWVNCHAQIQPNTPFGGCKMSGFGVEFGMEGLLEYTSQQLVFARKRQVS